MASDQQIYTLDHGNEQHPQPSPVTEASSPREKMLALLEALKDKQVVFMFGSPKSGKTAVLGSMVQAMQRPDVNGRFFLHGAADSYFKGGLIWWEEVRSAFKDKKFPRRTLTGGTIQIHAEFQPPDSIKPLNFVFLEMSGEDLETVEISDKGGYSFKFHIDQFLRITTLKMAFIIVTSWQDAKKDDAMISDFLNYINEKAQHLKGNRFIVLITKWDTKPGDPNESALDFIKRNMPATANKIAAAHNVVQPFSVGTVIHLPVADGGDIIQEFDYPAGQRLFARLYETFTGMPVEPKKSWLNRLFN